MQLYAVYSSRLQPSQYFVALYDTEGYTACRLAKFYLTRVHSQPIPLQYTAVPLVQGICGCCLPCL